jgi:sulfatase maturation enzyme AslB (radical SAM superfamily)
LEDWGLWEESTKAMVRKISEEKIEKSPGAILGDQGQALKVRIAGGGYATRYAASRQSQIQQDRVAIREERKRFLGALWYFSCCQSSCPIERFVSVRVRGRQKEKCNGHEST